MVTSAATLELGALVRDYGDPAGEAAACRSGAALFDFSFMHRARVEGPQAAGRVQSLTPRPIADLAPGRVRYALHVDAAGHACADLTIWRIDETTFEVFSGRADEIALLRTADPTAAVVTDLTDETAILAVQGPRSLACLSGLAPVEQLRDLAYFAHAAMAVAGLPCRVGRLGYTGERGFEIVAPRAAKDLLWAALARRARPAGFGAADMLTHRGGVYPLRQRAALSGDADRPRPRALRRRVRIGAARPSRRLSGAIGERPGTVRAEPRDRVSTSARNDPGDLGMPQPRHRGIIGLGYVAVAGFSGDLVDPTGIFHAVTVVGMPFIDPGKRRPRGAWDDATLRS